MKAFQINPLIVCVMGLLAYITSVFGQEIILPDFHVDQASQPAIKQDTIIEHQTYFRKLPEGNYRVRLTFGDEKSPSRTTVKAEARRLMVESLETREGESVTRDLIVNIRHPSLPDGGRVRLEDYEQSSPNWDDGLSLEFLGQNPKVSAIDIAPVELPTLFLAGDSTVADHMGEPYAAWGQMLPRFLKPVVAVANHAHPGASMESFEAAGRRSKIMSLIKPGDYLLIQFGHNDQKAHLPTYAAAKSLYRDLLRNWIGQAREKGAVPILVTPPERGFFDRKGHLKRTLDDYAEAVRIVATTEKIPMTDLNAASVALYESLGPEKVRFIFAKHGEDGDFTHNNNYGAWILARSVVEGLRNTPLSEVIVDDLAPFDPAQPPPQEELTLLANPVGQ